MLFNIAIENDSGRVDLPIKLVIFHSQVHLLKGKPILYAQFEQEFTLFFGQHFKAITNFWSWVKRVLNPSEDSERFP